MRQRKKVGLEKNAGSFTVECHWAAVLMGSVVVLWGRGTFIKKIKKGTPQGGHWLH